MVLTVNVGNTKITLAGYREGQAAFRLRLHTEESATADEYALHISQLLALHGCTGPDIEGVVLGSVVPSLTRRLTAALKQLTGRRILTVGPGLKSGVRLCLDDPGELGAELLCGCIAALEEAGGPVVILCADTALSMIAANAKREIVGGVIVPSPSLALESLLRRAAQLPAIDPHSPRKPAILSKNTAACVQSGILLGTAAQIDGLAEQFSAALGGDLRFFATGDLPQSLCALCRTPLEYRENLITDGMYALWQRNRKG